MCSAGTVTVHLRKDSLGHLSLVANPLTESRGPAHSPSGSAAGATRQKLRQTASSSGDAGPLCQWQHAQRAHPLKER